MAPNARRSKRIKADTTAPLPVAEPPAKVRPLPSSSAPRAPR